MCLIRSLQETGADAVFWNRRYGGGEIADRLKGSRSISEQPVKSTLRASMRNLLNEPWTVMRGEDAPYRVFTPLLESRARRRNTIRPRLRAPAIRSRRARDGYGSQRDACQTGRCCQTRPELGRTDSPNSWSPGESGALSKPLKNSWTP